MMHFRGEVLPFLAATVVFSLVLALVLRVCGMSCIKASVISSCVGLVVAGYMMYFFRDPDRVTPSDSNAVIAPADGKIALIVNMHESEYLKTDTVRISIFLSLFNVHVNRSPISGKSKFLGYFPGKRLFTFDEKSSEFNQHNAILITGEETSCLLKQIVGPVCRRVVYWPDHDNEVLLKAGDKIGMMKFGSRLDMYFPVDSIKVNAKVGDVVRAGETIIAVLNKEDAQ
jgi:phosphatidylserine decarboxylase